MQLLTGLAPEGAVAHIAWLGIDATITEPIPAHEVEANMHHLHEALEGLWKDAVKAQMKRRRGRPRKKLPVFNVGDMVLVAKAVKETKLDMTWTGPHEVIGTVNSFVYLVRPKVPDQGKRRPMKVHVVRMRRFSNAALATPADAVAIERAALQDYPDNGVERILADRLDADGLKLKIRWLGFDSTHDSHEPIANLAEDVPEQVEAYLRNNAHFPICAKALRRYF